MKQPKLISVIMSVYKEPIEWLKVTIDSILAQTYQNFEFIIVCDNPDYKEAISLLSAYEVNDGRIKSIINENNFGLTKSLNIALGASIGQFIARMDADDIAHIDRFSKQVDYLERHQDCMVCCTDARVIDKNGNVLRDRQTPGAFNILQLFLYSPIIHPSVMFRGEVLKLRNPLYNEEFRFSQDYELWSFLFLKDVTFGKIDEALMDYRISNGQISNLNNNKQKANSIIISKAFSKELLLRIIDYKEEYSIERCLTEVSNQYLKIADTEKVIYQEMLFRMYYTISRHSPLYAVKYFFDKNHLAFINGYLKNMHLILSIIIKHRYDMYLINI